MDTFRPQRSPGSERFLSLFSQSDATATAGVELHEDEVFWTGVDSFDSIDPPPRPSSPPMASPKPSPGLGLGLNFPKTSSSFRRPADRNFGILAALPEDDRKRPVPFLQRKPSIASACAAAASSTSTSPSSARMIPAIPKPKSAEYSLSVPAGRVYHQSAPVNVPVAPPKPRKGWGDLEFDSMGVDEEGDEDEMLPPHEIVARASAKDSPMTTFSVLEGVGRTLKGRDLRRVRNAVWHKTGFLD